MKIYLLSEFEKAVILENLADYEAGNVISNVDVISKNEKLLKE